MLWECILICCIFQILIFHLFIFRLLRGYESELANVALSTMESSRTVAQILYDIRLPDHQGL